MMDAVTPRVEELRVPSSRALIERLREIDNTLGIRAEAVSLATLLRWAEGHGVITERQHQAALDNYPLGQLYA
jgi:hypothetical protein